MRQKIHTIRLLDDTIIKKKGVTSKLIESFKKANAIEDMLLFKSISCNNYSRGKKSVYTYCFSLMPRPTYSVNVRSRDTKHAVNLSNTVWDSPYHIPLDRDLEILGVAND